MSLFEFSYHEYAMWLLILGVKRIVVYVIPIQMLVP